MRRSMLFSPANNLKRYASAAKLNPDCIIFDLEDAISISEKASARTLLASSLSQFDFNNSEVFVRINALHSPYGVEDVKAIIPAGIRNIRLPMCESESDIRALDTLLGALELSHHIPHGSVKIQAAIETPKGVLNAKEIASASPRLISLSFGAEDFTKCLGIKRSPDLTILDHARCQIVLVCQQYGLDAIDTVWSDLSDLEGFKLEGQKAKNMGFSGKSCIHPSQIEPLHDIFSPSKALIRESLEIVSAAKKAELEGIGVIALHGKMIDRPIVEKAKSTLVKAQTLPHYDALIKEILDEHKVD